MQAQQRPFPQIKPEIGQLCTVFFTGERHGRRQLPLSATWTESGWQFKGYISPELVETIYAWQPLDLAEVQETEASTTGAATR